MDMLFSSLYFHTTKQTKIQSFVISEYIKQIERAFITGNSTDYQFTAACIYTLHVLLHF